MLRLVPAGAPFTGSFYRVWFRSHITISTPVRPSTIVRRLFCTVSVCLFFPIFFLSVLSVPCFFICLFFPQFYLFIAIYFTSSSLYFIPFPLLQKKCWSSGRNRPLGVNPHRPHQRFQQRQPSHRAALQLGRLPSIVLRNTVSQSLIVLYIVLKVALEKKTAARRGIFLYFLFFCISLLFSLIVLLKLKDLPLLYWCGREVRKRENSGILSYVYLPYRYRVLNCLRLLGIQVSIERGFPRSTLTPSALYYMQSRRYRLLALSKTNRQPNPGLVLTRAKRLC